MTNILNRATTAPKHYPALDGLRGLAVLLVMMHHFIRGYESNGRFHTFALQWTEFMWTGVDLFFVLSGFLITGILLETLRSTNYLRTFYARRILRIFPVYYGLLVIAFVLLPLVQLSLPVDIRAASPFFFTFTSNIHMALSGWGHNPFDVYWSLAVEEQFYLFWPLTLLIVPARYHKSLVISGLVAGVILRYVAVHIGVSSVFLFTMLPTHADGLLVGALVSMIVHSNAGLQQISGRIQSMLIVFIGIFFLAAILQPFGFRLFYDAWNTRGAMFYYLLIATAYGCLLIVLIGEPNWLQRLFENKTLRLAGTYSYCLYLIHEMVSDGMNWVYVQTGFESVLLRGMPVVRDIAHLLPIFTVSFGIAALSWRFVERPILKLKRHFPYRHTFPDAV